MTVDNRRIWSIIGVISLVLIAFVPLSSLLFNVYYDYTLTVVAFGGAMLGLVSGVLGTFAVLRQQSLIGDALSHAALPGVAIAFLLAGRDLGILLVGAGIASWVAINLIGAITQTTRIKQDTAMGMILAAFFAFGIAFLSYIQGRPDASQAGLDKFIFGQAAAIVQQDVILILVVGFISFAVLALFWKEFKLITFDPEFANANGFLVRRLDILLSTLIVVAIVLGLQLAGVILMVGLLIAPAVAARQWTNHLGQMVVLAGIFGIFAGASGAIISAVDVGIPTGPLIIVMASVVVFVSIFFAPGRGLLWVAIRRRGDQRRFAAQNVLRDIYHHGLQHQDPTYPAPESLLVNLRGTAAKIGLQALKTHGVITQQNGGWSLTTTGLKRVENDIHNQQLWEVYRQYRDELTLPLIPEDRQRAIHDLLPNEIVQQLEKLLAKATV